MFRGITIVPAGTRIPFMRVRAAYLIFSVALMVVSVALVGWKGLNYGIDFTGGIMIEAKFSQKADIPALRDKLGGLDLGAVEIQEFGAPDDVLIRIQRQTGDEKAQMAAIDKVKQTLGAGVDYRRVESVGPKVGGELMREAIVAVALALLGIMIYLWFRFEWQWGLSGLISLLHDVVATVGVFALSGLEFNLSTVAALLLIAGYSINDTVVVFDRLRENLRKFKTTSLIELMDRSMNETLSRTINTSGTTLFAILALFLFGGAVIRDFTFALLFGIAIGTYSSVCVAVPLLLYMKIHRPGSGREIDDGKEGEAAT